MPKEKMPSKTKTTRPSKALKPTEDSASVHASDKLEQLRSALPLFYMTLAWTYLDGGGDVTAHIINSYLPSRALELAQSCGLVSDAAATMMIFQSERSDLLPTAIPDGFLGPDEAAIGPWCVTKRFKEDFMRLLERPITSLKAIAASEQALLTDPTAIRWKTPTPKQHIDTFLARNTYWTKVWIVKQVSGINHKVDEATDQFLKRLYRQPTEPPKRGYTARNWQRLQRLRDVMAREYPDKFSQYTTVDHLIWTPE